MPINDFSLLKPGAPETLGERLVAYISSFDPSFASAIRGATKDDINTYEQVSGMQMPASFRSYLRAMGEDDAGLLKMLRLQLSAQRMIRMYRRCLESEPETLSPTFPMIGTYIVGDQISFDLRTPRPEPSVVESTDGEAGEYLAASWEHLVFKAAFYLHQRTTQPLLFFSASELDVRRALAAPQDPSTKVRERFQAFLAMQGAVLSWPSDDVTQIAIGSGVSFMLTLFARGAFTLRLFGPGIPDTIALEKFAFDLGAAMRIEYPPEPRSR